MKRVLAVEDEPLLLDTLNLMLKHLGYEPVLATKGETAIQAFRRDKPHLTILDLGLPDMNGLDVLKRIRTLAPDAPVIILTGTGSEEMEIEVRKLGVSDFLLKGFSLHTLKDSMGRALQNKE